MHPFGCYRCGQRIDPDRRGFCRRFEMSPDEAFGIPLESLAEDHFPLVDDVGGQQLRLLIVGWRS
jgi:hypothetical protein